MSANGSVLVLRIPQIIKDPLEYDSYEFDLMIYWNEIRLMNVAQSAAEHSLFETLVTFHLLLFTPRTNYTGVMKVSKLKEGSNQDSRTYSDVLMFQTG